MDKLVSVIIPSFNHEKYVEQTIRSVLEQTYKNIELIVVDDGSKDKSPEVLRKLQNDLRFKLILKTENEGLCAALNDGLKLVTGEYVVMFGSDDLMPPSRIYEQVECFKRNPDLDIIAGAIQKIDSGGRPIEESSPRSIGLISFEQMLSQNLIYAPTAMIKKSVFDRFGKYDPEIVLEDYYLWLKVLENGGRISNFENLWAKYRIIGVETERKLKWYFQGAKQVLSRYTSNELARNHLKTLTFRFLLKMLALKNEDALRSYKEDFQTLSFIQKITLRIFSILPKDFKNKLIKRYSR